MDIGSVDITDDTLSRLSWGSPDGVLCPKLERLDWRIDVSYTLLPFFHLFLSPHLKHINLFTLPDRGMAPQQGLSCIEKIILHLPSSLEDISLMCGPWNREPLKDAISSLLLRYGPSLRSFGSNTPLSEEAFNHLVRLPNLRSWVAFSKPPRTLPKTAFPSLEQLHLESGALPWLHLLTTPGNGKLQNGLGPAAVTPNTKIGETLKFLHCHGNTPVDPTLLSSILLFRNLVLLYVDGCHCRIGSGCTFPLTDDDVENLAAALPSLASLELGRVCGFNSCHTTISSLWSLSVHCPSLTILEVHFNTNNIVGDIRRLLGDDSRHEKTRCKLRHLSVGLLPLQVWEEDVGIVGMGFVDIFPCLDSFWGCSMNLGGWIAVESKLRD